ncbi:DUF554 domain-containing protein [Paenibacillus sp. GCM10012306]|uniref:DUF554 domain-containing protein n=1 Tax=Paenibacillus sp. GCM10012306 TaxID=3317342 RepID=UPI003623A78D
MLGTAFNVLMIILGSIIGSVFKKGIKNEYQEMLMNAMGLAALALGVNSIVQHMPSSKYPVLFIVSLALGVLIGQKINLEERFSTVVSRFSKGKLAEGLSTAILLFCMGSLSILGPIEAALKGDMTYLFTNGMLDFITSIVLASTFGIGIALSALVLFCWQGSFFLIAKLVESSLNADLLNEISIIGGVLILCSGLSILGIKKMKTLNILPALAIPPLMFLIMFVFNIK